MENSFSQPQFRSSPMTALRSTIDSPNWLQNVLWLSIAVLLNSVFIGQIAIFGYGAELLHRRGGHPDGPKVDVDSDRIGDYISKGIWPFVVHFLVQIVVGIVVLIPIVLLVALGMGMGAMLGGEEAMGVSVILMIPFIFALAIGSAVFSVPFLINAMICQDFQRSLDLGWALGFTKLMFWEMITSAIVYWLLSIVVIFIGFLFLCVGYIPATGIVAGGAMHLLSQWYEVYLSKGGVPINPPENDVIDASIV